MFQGLCLFKGVRFFGTLEYYLFTTYVHKYILGKKRNPLKMSLHIFTTFYIYWIALKLNLQASFHRFAGRIQGRRNFKYIMVRTTRQQDYVCPPPPLYCNRFNKSKQPPRSHNQFRRPWNHLSLGKRIQCNALLIKKLNNGI